MCGAGLSDICFVQLRHKRLVVILARVWWGSGVATYCYCSLQARNSSCCHCSHLINSLSTCKKFLMARNEIPDQTTCIHCVYCCSLRWNMSLKQCFFWMKYDKQCRQVSGEQAENVALFLLSAFPWHQMKRCGCCIAREDGCMDGLDTDGRRCRRDTASTCSARTGLESEPTIMTKAYWIQRDMHGHFYVLSPFPTQNSKVDVCSSVFTNIYGFSFPFRFWRSIYILSTNQIANWWVPAAKATSGHHRFVDTCNKKKWLSSCTCVQECFNHCAW